MSKRFAFYLALAAFILGLLAGVVLEKGRNDRVLRTATVKVMNNGETRHKLGSANFWYCHQEAASIETRVRLLKSGTYVEDQEDAAKAGRTELYNALADLPGIQRVHMRAWSVMLEKTTAFTWAEIEPDLEKVLKKHHVA